MQHNVQLSKSPEQKASVEKREVYIKIERISHSNDLLQK
jgi:SepF-like predicted cell division protein (DUF552 family)